MKKIIFISLLFSFIFAQGTIKVLGKDATATSDAQDQFMKLYNGYSINIDKQLFDVEQGNVYTFSKTWVSVADDSSAWVRLKTTTDKMKFEIYLSTEAKVYLKTYAGSTYSDTGSVYTPFNRLIGSTNTSTAIVTYDCVYDSLGAMRGDDLLGGSGSTKAGGETNRILSVLLPNRDVLIRVQNKAGQAKDINVIINYIEEQ